MVAILAGEFTGTGHCGFPAAHCLTTLLRQGTYCQYGIELWCIRIQPWYSNKFAVLFIHNCSQCKVLTLLYVWRLLSFGQRANVLHDLTVKVSDENLARTSKMWPINENKFLCRLLGCWLCFEANARCLVLK